MTNPRNAPKDPIRTIEGLQKNLDEFLQSDSLDFETIAFTITHIQRIALHALASPQHLPTPESHTAQGGQSLRLVQMTRLAQLALDAVETTENYLRHGQKYHNPELIDEPAPADIPSAKQAVDRLQDALSTPLNDRIDESNHTAHTTLIQES